MPTCTSIQIQYLKAQEKLLILPPTALSFIKGKEGYKMIWNPRKRFGTHSSGCPQDSGNIISFFVS